MAVKTITIDIEAYELLRRHKRPEQSFSQVIKEQLGSPGGTALDLMAAVKGTRLSAETLDAMDAQVRRRRLSPVRIPRL